jgi:hypothetical protein
MNLRGDLLRMKADRQQESKGYLFNVDILIDGRTNGMAHEKLIQLLNNSNLVSYRIRKGIEQDKQIESALPATPSSTIKQVPISNPKKTEQTAFFIEQLTQLKEKQTLIRMKINKGKGVKLDMPCRVLNLDVSTQNVSVYHVDEKQVYLLKFSEIDDLIF